MDWIDNTERQLIIKFFGIDPVHVVSPKCDSYYLGSSDFYNIVEFYKFEYKPHEKQFWDILYPKLMKYPNTSVPLVMSKVNVGYEWLDYVTDVNIQYEVVDNELNINIEYGDDVYQNALILICNMLFISDFNEVSNRYQNVDKNQAINYIMSEANKLHP